MCRALWSAALFLCAAAPLAAAEPLRIICFGAHPDDCELKVGGTAALWAAKVLGIETEVLDIHDGVLEPTLANRKTVTRLIREWKADIVMSHRPNDYHPDHRYTGVLVQDAAYMVAVPKLLPDVPHLKRNPVFVYYSDRFQKPNPFKPDVVVALDDVEAKKLAALERIVSQFYEGGATGGPENVPDDTRAQEKRKQDVRQALLGRDRATAKQYRDKLAELYGKDPSAKVEFAEAFEVCEYGRQPNAEELRRLFPFFEK